MAGAFLARPHRSSEAHVVRQAPDARLDAVGDHVAGRQAVVIVFSRDRAVIGVEILHADRRPRGQHVFDAQAEVEANPPFGRGVRPVVVAEVGIVPTDGHTGHAGTDHAVGHPTPGVKAEAKVQTARVRDPKGRRSLGQTEGMVRERRERRSGDIPEHRIGAHADNHTTEVVIVAGGQTEELTGTRAGERKDVPVGLQHGIRHRGAAGAVGADSPKVKPGPVPFLGRGDRSRQNQEERQAGAEETVIEHYCPLLSNQ